MGTLRYVVVDVFTDTPLAGNQLAVFTDARGLDDATMQALALEIGFSETVFVLSPEAGGSARIRIFTPYFELPFAGHPTLGTAFVLGAPLQLVVITLETGARQRAGRARARRVRRIVFGRMEQPVPTVDPLSEATALFEALGVGGSELPGRALRQRRHPPIRRAGLERGGLGPAADIEALQAFAVTGVSCFAGSGNEWTTRMFWRGGEDAATGSAAGPLACHLARHGRIAWGEEITISQGGAIGRPSTLYARAEGGEGLIDRVEVGGQAVTVARGEFRL